MSRLGQHFGVTAALLIALFVLVPSTRLDAQEAATAPPSASEERRAETPGQQLAEQSREAAGENTQEHLKKSPSVQFLSRVTGLSMQGAFWLGQLLNFGVVALAIAWLLKKNLPGAFRSRTVSIQKSMEEARRASEDANRRLAEIESRLARLDGAINEMRATAEQESAAEEQRITAATEEDARKILDSAEQEIAAAAKLARRELTAYATELAVSLARQNIRLDTHTDEGLVRGFAERLTGNGNSGVKGGR
jgi:F-type H+-transporting ATPase subunit b